tara:strand:+ start:50 stop:328 length:279 start_codon:yes stop_codon:yes gene_type:complete
MAFKMKGFSGFKRVDPYADQKAAKQDYYKKEKSKKENYYNEKKGVEKKPVVNTRKKFKDTKVGKFLGVGQGDKRKARREERKAGREIKRNTK